jgi:hypothetical protein
MEFQKPEDIANRALQHCGTARLDQTLGFNEKSKNSRETAFAYGKLRRAELRRNVWRFATRRTVIRAIDGNTMRLDPALWSSTVTYFGGSIVADQSGNIWISNLANNLNNDPLLTNYWEPYFGPLTVSLYDTATSYFSGEVVYTTAGDGTNRVFLSLLDGNTDNPATATAYDPTVTYFKNQVVTYLTVPYMSLIDLNLNNEPDLAPALWAVGTTYAAGAKVGGSDGVIYQSIGAGNVGHDPTTDNGANWTNTGVLNPWTTVFTGGTGSDKWLEIGGREFPSGVTLATLGIVYPLGAGPSWQQASRNVFRLPNGFLRLAPQDPKASTTWLGAPSGLTYNDWNLESNYLVTAECGPIPLRFVADVTDVRRMDDMFCEGLAARIAVAVCDILTQSQSQLASIEKAYSVFMSEARSVNAIEMGYDTPPDDDYLTVRY